jgi:large subunit ribosomal protein L22
MKSAIAKTRYVRISPRKARLAAGLIRGKEVQEAVQQLQFSNLKGSRLLLKTLNSAVANAETQQEVRREELAVLTVQVDEGPTMKRAKSRSKGSRSPIMKRTSHLTVVVGSEEL